MVLEEASANAMALIVGRTGGAAATQPTGRLTAILSITRESYIDGLVSPWRAQTLGDAETSAPVSVHRWPAVGPPSRLTP
jgi:hypothetical protein